MPTYRVIDKTTGKTAYAYRADAPVEFPEFPFTQFNHVEVVPLADGTAPVTQGYVITKLDFLKRFTSAEYGLFKSAAAQSSDIDFFWQKLMAASEVDLNDPETVAGVNALEQLGILAAGRAAQILALL